MLWDGLHKMVVNMVILLYGMENITFTVQVWVKKSNKAPLSNDKCIEWNIEIK
jgi:hypothetical protein